MRFYLTILNLLLITGGAYFGVSLFYQTAASKLITENSRIAAVGKAQSVDKESHNPLGEYRHIKERNLFHIKAKQTAEIVEEKVDI